MNDVEIEVYRNKAKRYASYHYDLSVKGTTLDISGYSCSDPLVTILAYLDYNPDINLIQYYTYKCELTTLDLLRITDELSDITNQIWHLRCRNDKDYEIYLEDLSIVDEYFG